MSDGLPGDDCVPEHPAEALREAIEQRVFWAAKKFAADSNTQEIENEIRSILQTAVEAEREACARVCENRAGTVSMFATLSDTRAHNNAVRGDAAEIRARTSHLSEANQRMKSLACND